MLKFIGGALMRLISAPLAHIPEDVEIRAALRKRKYPSLCSLVGWLIFGIMVIFREVGFIIGILRCLHGIPHVCVEDQVIGAGGL